METMKDTAPAEKDYGEKFVAKVVAEKQKKADGSETVADFTEDVQKQAKAHVEKWRKVAGEDVVRVIEPQVMQASEGFKEAKEGILDPHAKVSKKADQLGAAGFSDKSDNSVTYAPKAMDKNLKDPGYWSRVRRHEQIHQQEQAAHMNREKVAYVDDAGDIAIADVDALVEWHPSSEANISSDLPPSYHGHVKEGDALAAKIGADRIKEALGSGDMAALQQDIVKRQREEMLAALEPQYALAG